MGALRRLLPEQLPDRLLVLGLVLLGIGLAPISLSAAVVAPALVLVADNLGLSIRHPITASVLIVAVAVVVCVAVIQ